MKLAEHFNRFLADVVNLNQTRIDTLKSRVDAIVSTLEGFDVYSDILIDTTPQGSWAHRTIIKPTGSAGAFDADVVAFVEPHDEWTPADYIDHLYDQFRSHGTYEDTWLNFKATHSFTNNVAIRWQVVNTGWAARIARCLRGGFDHSGSDIWECTKYTGKHWVECFAVDLKREVSLGRSGRFYVNIS